MPCLLASVPAEIVRRGVVQRGGALLAAHRGVDRIEDVLAPTRDNDMYPQ
jgi:hypothetical protein